MLFKKLNLIVYFLSFQVLFTFVNLAVTADQNSTVISSNSVPKKVADVDIQNRLRQIFKITKNYPNLELEVQEGLVILKGAIENKDRKEWALNIIEKTEGVVAVIDKLDEKIASSAVLNPAKDEVSELYVKMYKSLPYIASSIVLLVVFTVLSSVSKRISVSILSKRGKNPLLVRAFSNSIGIVILILGLYFALKASGLTTLSVTLLGGTGMLGLGLGLALKSTFENYISSIMISFRQLLKIGELVNIDGHEGIVQSVTSRGTTLMDYDGNNIIIPNTQVFNTVITNYTRNPIMRVNFSVGIGYDDSIDLARKTILSVLEEFNEFVLANPSPNITVESLGASTVNLKIYFWFNTDLTSKLKISSAVVQRTKEKLIEENVSMPDDAREVVFTSPLKIENISNNRADKSDSKNEASKPRNERLAQDLTNEIIDLKKQALESPKAENGENLI